MKKEKVTYPETVIDMIQEIILSKETGVSPIRALAMIYVLVCPGAAERFLAEGK